MKGYHVFVALFAMVLAMCAMARENPLGSSTNTVAALNTNTGAALGTNTVGRVVTNDTTEAKIGRYGVQPPSVWADAIKFAADVRLASSNLLVETAMIRDGMMVLSNRVNELIARSDIPKLEPSPRKEVVQVVVVTNTVVTVDRKFTEEVLIRLNTSLERVKSAITDLSGRLLAGDASSTKKKDVTPQTKGSSPNTTVVFFGISFIVWLAILAFVVMVKAAVSAQTGELSEGRALLLDKLPGAVGENLRSRFEDMAQNKSRTDDQFNDLANAIGDLKEMVRDGLRPRETDERRRVPSVVESPGGISTREEEERLRMRVHELEVRLREKDGELSGMKAREGSAALKSQDDVKVAQENEARMRKELDLVNGRLAEATARLERQSMSELSFMSAEAFKKAKADMEEWRGEFPDEVAVIKSALSLIHRRKFLSKGTWSSALRDVAATVSGVLERRGTAPEAVRQTLNDWSVALDRLAQSSPEGTFALSLPQIGDQVDSSWMTTVGGALPSRVGAVRTWAVYIDGKIQCYAEVK